MVAMYDGGRVTVRWCPPRVRLGFHKFWGNTSDRDAVRSKLQGNSVTYSFGWEADGNFHADRYFREHLTTSGGWWAEQRTVSACVRYTAKPGGPVMASVACPDRLPFTERVDEQVTIP